MPNNKISPLKVRVDDGMLKISIGIDLLSFIAVDIDANYHEDLRPIFLINNSENFAKDIVAEMNSEEENGSTPTTDFIEGMIIKTIDQGSLAVDLADNKKIKEKCQKWDSEKELRKLEKQNETK